MSPRVGAIPESEEDAWVIFERTPCAEGERSSAASDSGSTELGSERESPRSISDEDRLRLDDPSPKEGRRYSIDETLVVFDWDDTLLPTTWLERIGLLDNRGEPTQDQRDALAKLEERVLVTLNEAERCGQVIIITNAIEGWVQDSCARFFPKAAPVINSLRIISARSTFEPKGMSLPTQWKVCAFEQEVDAFCNGLRSDQVANIVSVGDSAYEHQALLAATETRQYCFSKSLILLGSPTLNQLTEEHYLMEGTLFDVAQYDGDLDVDVGNAAQVA